MQVYLVYDKTTRDKENYARHDQTRPNRTEQSDTALTNNYSTSVAFQAFVYSSSRNVCRRRLDDRNIGTANVDHLRPRKQNIYTAGGALRVTRKRANVWLYFCAAVIVVG